MGQASKIMYKIANVFNWIVVVISLLAIVFSILGMCGVNLGDTKLDTNVGFGTSLFGAIWLFVFAVVLIILTRIAYKSGSGKGWDILFLILGILDGNIFYFLGGLFGLLSKN